MTSDGPAAGDPDRPPAPWSDIFIVGAPRSGTTWLQAVLSNSPDLVTCPETEVFLALGEARSFWGRDNQEMGLQTVITSEGYDRWLASLWAGIRSDLLAVDGRATRVLEKTPHHADHIDTIRALVPGDELAVVTPSLPTGFSFHDRPGSMHRELAPAERRYVEHRCRVEMERLGYAGARDRLPPVDQARFLGRAVPRGVRAAVRRLRRVTESITS